MARGAGGLLDGGFVFKLGRLFKTPYGGEGVDFIDQLNYQFTGGLMVIFIAIISFRQYVDHVTIDILNNEHGYVKQITQKNQIYH
ncbi:hypothetical protein Smp_073380 [Schistosoma mansoni]|uniref:hypothetical protein n=1 Tax=Schistosoma mansoni TaxID=6183 RepID=UPI0001A620E0|nr:hypothetical protein Smp_073380 [Schistosoma mansoni]|eukprot:XP_018655539.1 hypothetical protein Smp_073380 [Schistosoma mansoni]